MQDNYVQLICIDDIRDLKSAMRWAKPRRAKCSRDTDLAGRAFNPDGKIDGVEGALKGIPGNPPGSIGIPMTSNIRN